SEGAAAMIELIKPGEPCVIRVTPRPGRGTIGANAALSMLSRSCVVEFLPAGDQSEDDTILEPTPQLLDWPVDGPSIAQEGPPAAEATPEPPSPTEETES